MELSKRLRAVAGLVTEGASVADIGTDHGYIPIYLARQGSFGRLIAMDINKGPLMRAQEHIKAHGMEHRIETRLSDGFETLAPGEADTIIAAGMGGGLVIHILQAYPDVTESIKEFVLQPQSEIAKVRRYLWDNDFRIVAENMVEEDGKFYPMMKAVHGKAEQAYSDTELCYGRFLLRRRHPVLHMFLRREQRIKSEIIESLSNNGNTSANERVKELYTELRQIEEALAAF